MVKASKRKRKQSKDTPLSPNTKEARKDVIGKYALEVLDVKTSGKAHKETYGATAAIIQKAQTVMPWITPKMITSKAERLVKEARKKKPLEDSTNSAARIAGRPKGSTIQLKKDLEARKLKAKLLMVDRLREAQEDAKSRGLFKVANLTFKKIRYDALKELKLEGEDFSVSQNTIKDRVGFNRASVQFCRMTH
jgi:hypothetical protein